MPLTASDVASLTAALSRWEWGEYVCAGLVALGCLGEFVSEFTRWLTDGDEKKRHGLAKLSTLLLVVSLVGELVCLIKTNQISARLTGSLSQVAEEGREKAAKALEDSTGAIARSAAANNNAIAASKLASAAEQTSNLAESNSGSAKRAASGAGQLARRVRLDLDTSVQRVADLKTEVANAEEQLAQEERVRLELQGSLAPREMYFLLFDDGTTNVDELKQFAGIEAVIDFAPDVEVRRATSNIVFILQRAGWRFGSICPATEFVQDGIEIRHFLGRTASEMQSNGDASWGASRALWKVLRENKWKSHYISASSGEILHNQVKIRVGFKAGCFFRRSSFQGA